MTAVCCPRCTTSTVVPSHDVHVCTGCGGVWLDDERARRLLAPLGADLQPSSTPMTAPIGCSWCGQTMTICHTRLAGVEIDVCESHGAWFDRHELERISQAVSQMLGQPVPQAPSSWSHAQPLAGPPAGPPARWGAEPGSHAGKGMPPAPKERSGGGWVAGAAAVGVGVAAGAAYAVYGNPEQPATRTNVGSGGADAISGDAISGAVDGVDVGEAVGGVGEAVGGAVEVAGDALGSIAEVGGDVAEAAGSVLGVVFEAIGGIFS